jgi:NADPH:quinone reductase
MRAYFTKIIDGYSILIPGSADKPSPEKDEVLIKVKATGLNRGGFIVGGVMHGKQDKPSGTEASGEIISVGSKVKGYKPGDNIMGRVLGTKSGSFAEYALLKEYQIMPIPYGYTWEQAAAIPVSFLAAYDAVITYGKLSKDQTMLITSISSAIGVSALQIGKILGAKVIGTSTSSQKIDQLRNIGMDFGILTPEEDLTKKIMEFSKNGLNLIINCLGGSVFEASIDSLAFKGIIVSVGYMDGIDKASIDLRKIHAQRISVHGVSNAFVQKEDIISTVNGFKEKILPHLRENKFKPIIDKVFDFDDIDNGRKYMMNNSQIGKIVIKL